MHAKHLRIANGTAGPEAGIAPQVNMHPTNPPAHIIKAM
jgi:hypothetical protein